MLAEIISIGDELMTGLVVNTNAAFISESLTRAGHEVKWITAVGDDEAEVIQAFQQADRRAQIIVVTGGLGPTHDDLTKKAVVRFFHSKLVLRKDVRDRIEAFFISRGRTMSPSNEVQAWIPDKAELIENEIGTAPGLLFRRKGKLWFFLPGVPSEAKCMMQNSVLTQLSTIGHGTVFRSRMLKTVGIPESDLYDQLSDFPARFPGVKLAFLPQTPGVTLRLVVFGTDADACDLLISQAEQFIREKAGQYIYGQDEDTIEQVVASLLLSNRMTIAVAESCTGGLIAHKLTNIPGSSAYFERGVVAYSNASKIGVLGVSEKTIRERGAVSAETASAMAEGIRRISGTDIGLSTTGIAGPGGGTEEKPVGLVYIGFCDARRTLVERHIFPRDRLWNKERSAVVALDWIRRLLSE
jgi:nicotinamide-nucleotide amidase